MTQRVLQIAPDLALPLDAATRRMAILAMSGAGKSNTAVVLAEAMFDAGIPWVAIDPKGDWWGVRSSRSGKGPGLPIPIFGGAHGDVPLEPDAGKTMADVVHAQRLTCVVDVSEFDERQQLWAFLTDFGNELLRLHKRRPQVLHLFCEECDEYIPQKPSEKGNQVKCLGTWQRVVKKGRTLGLGSTQITQRNASLNKDTLYMAELLIAMRVTGKGDREAIRGWVDHHSASAAIVDSLPSLGDGEGWVTSPAWLRETRRVHFNRRRTFDSGSTPVLLQGDLPPATLADVDLDQLRTRMAATIEKAKAEDPDLLRRQIAQLQRELAQAKRTPAAAPAVAAAPRVEIKTVEVPILKDSQIKALERTIAQVEQLVAGTSAIAGKLTERAAVIEAAGRGLGGALADVRKTIAAAAAPRPPVAPLQTSAKPAAPAPRPPVRSVLVPVETTYGADVGPDPVANVEQRILNALAELEQLGAATPERELVGFLAGYSNTTSKYFRRALASLKDSGQVRFPTEGLVELGDAGRARAAPPAGPASPEELHTRIVELLGGVTAKVLQGILAAHPDPADRAEIARAAGFNNLTSKNCRQAFARLKALGFIDYPTPGQVRALPVLFPGL